ncbi:hypothetical protein [Lysobacter sp. M2-1]|uniref:hypothetical protein n=1 Tax=Lysobacter sp. M2-1 TaxID=2916839 RepID=UPI001F5663EB|nr:hypothetical protein [Lysobacter sp. M2-1]
MASSTLASCLLGLLFSTAASATGTVGIPTPVDVDLSCKDFDTAGILNEVELLVSPLPEGPTLQGDGVLAVSTISFESTNGWLLYWIQESTGQSIHHVSLSGAGSAVLYSYDPPVTHDEGLHLPAPQTALFQTMTTTPGYPQAANARFCYSTPQETGFEGCTLGYWKVRQHHDSWPAPYYPGSNLQVAFGADAFNDSFLNALNYKGGPGIAGAKRILLKQAVAALLGATSPDVDYPITTATVTSQVAAALASNDREIMLSLSTTLDAYNNQGCPLN